MAPGLLEESLLAAKFALFVATGGLMLRSDPRRRHHHQDLAFEVHLSANLITLVLGLLLMYVSIVASPDSTTTGKGKLMMWVTLFMSVVTLLLSSYLLIFAN